MFVRRTTTKAVNGSHSIMKMGQVRTMGTIPQDTKNTFVKFDFMDGLNMNNLLDEEEQMIVDQVKAYAQEELMPRVKEVTTTTTTLLPSPLYPTTSHTPYFTLF
eukprot:TRINITY_DN3323_c1_g1_i10.p1 TRINITY_DN3323_c1_g1~~TRINITY_DN3323_c1_g1_i10.p1  ORF type:complete len:111 (+),score=30.03 TRINITY_DN3323_c1_g1_i10:23-334(+)